MNAESLSEGDIRILSNLGCQFLLEDRLGNVVYHLSAGINIHTAGSSSPEAWICRYLWRVVQHGGVHALVGQSPDRIAGEAGDKVDPEGICSWGSQPADAFFAEAVLTEDLETSRVDSVSLGGCQTLGMALYDEGFDFEMVLSISEGTIYLGNDQPYPQVETAAAPGANQQARLQR